MPAERKPRSPRGLNPKQEAFVALILGGKSGVDAYIAIYGQRKASRQEIANRAYRLQRRGLVSARIAQLKGKQEKGTLLTVNQRLRRLSEIAALPIKRHSSAIVRALQVYTQIAGGGAPQKVEVSTPAGQPIEIASAKPRSAKQTIALLVAARKAEEQAGA